MNSKPNPIKKKLDGVEAKMVSGALERSGWRLTTASKLLGIPLSTLQYAIKRNKKLMKAYARHGHGRGRPFGRRKPK